MFRLCGRKVHDLALAAFLDVLQWVTSKKGKVVSFINRWYPSSKTCSNCGYVLDSLALDMRLWCCPYCHKVNEHDENASVNIKNIWTSTFSRRFEDKMQYLNIFV
ncbi:MAG: zinc ribbon domain-containing protein [Pseudanabaena sp.]